MKNKTLVLFRAQLRSRFSLSGMTRAGGGKNAGLKRAGVALLLLYALGVFLWMYCAIVSALTDAAVAMEFPDIALDLEVTAAMAACFVFGIFVVLSNLFLVRDGELLCSLPVTPRQIFMSKFMTVYLTELLITAFFMIPAVVIFAIKARPAAPVFFFLRALGVTALLPAIPLLAASVAVIPLMLLASRAKRRDLFVTVGSVVLFLGFMILQLRLNSAMTAAAGEEGFFAAFLRDNFSKLSAVTVPPMSWASNAIYGGGLTSLMTGVCFIIAVAVCFGITWALMGSLYRAALRAGLESHRSGKKISSARLAAPSGTPVRAIIRREWRVLLRSPIYLLNSLSGALVAVIFIAMPLFGGSDETADAFSALVSSVRGEALLLVLAGATALLSCLNMGAGSVVSRQGSAFWITKAVPVSYGTQAKAFLIFGTELCLTWAVPVFLGAVFALRLPVLTALGGFALGMLLSAGVSALGMVFDFFRPKLSWTNEAEAIKQNLNTVFGALAAIAGLFVVGLPVYLVAFRTSAPGWCAVLLAALLGALLTAGSWYYIIKRAAPRLNDTDC